MKSNFLGWIQRQRIIKRWNRQVNASKTDIDLPSHCLNVSVVAHLLAEIDNNLFGANHHAERIALLGLYHECAEVITSDLQHPVKYATPAITKEIKALEHVVEVKCADSLPPPLKDLFSTFIIQKNIDDKSKLMVKAADDIVAFFKCKEEFKLLNNLDFEDSFDDLESKVYGHAKNLRCVDWFLLNFDAGHQFSIKQLMAKDS